MCGNIRRFWKQISCLLFQPGILAVSGAAGIIELANQELHQQGLVYLRYSGVSKTTGIESVRHILESVP